MAKFVNKPFHICLLGSKICNDLLLIRTLSANNILTLQKRKYLVSSKWDIAAMDAFLISCKHGENLSRELYPVIRQIKTLSPDVSILLINGGLNQTEIATAFKEGVRDYFSEPYDVHLLCERIINLAKNRFNDNPLFSM